MQGSSEGESNPSFEFAQLRNMNRDYFQFAKKGRIAVESINLACITYSWNMERVGYMATVLTDGMFYAGLSNRGVGPDIPFGRGTPADDVKARFGTEAAAAYTAAYNGTVANLEQQGVLFARDFRWESSTSVLDGYKADERLRARPLGHGIEALFCAMILNAYAAMETLAGDLWIAMVNLCPDLIPSDREHPEGRLFDFRDLKDYNFNVEGRVGEFLHHAEKVGFQSRAKILVAYEMAFGKTSKEYNAFTKNTDLEKSEKVRHLIAHKGGRVDARFLKDVKDWEEFSDVREGKHLPLTGSRVCSLINPCVTTAVDLITAVDRRATRYERWKRVKEATGTSSGNDVPGVQG